MTRFLSLYFDGWRVLAASLVLIWHTQGVFSDGALLRALHFPTGAEHLAVIIFFVLSGYLISRAAHKPGNDFKRFAIDRLARLSSVVIPGIALTAFIAWIVPLFQPEAGLGILSQSWQSVRYFVNTAYLQQIWPFCVVPGMNTPFWSLGYEFWYYAFIGIWVFWKRRGKWTACVLLCLFLGPKILALFPTWLFGALIERIVNRLGRSDEKHYKALILFTITLFIIGFWFCYPTLIPFWSYKIGCPPWYYSANVAADTLFAFVVATNFYWAAIVSRSLPTHFSGKSLEMLNVVIGWFAGRSFSVYLYHVPLLFAAGWCLPYNHSDWRDVLWVLGVVLLIIFLLAEVTERKVSLLKAALTST